MEGGGFVGEGGAANARADDSQTAVKRKRKRKTASSSSSSSSSSTRRFSRGGGRRSTTTKFEVVGSEEARAKTPKVYDVGVTCKQHWREMAKKIMEPWDETGITRDSMDKIPLSVMGHTPMRLRVIRGKLHCVVDPRLEAIKTKLGLKTYRARQPRAAASTIISRALRRLPMATTAPAAAATTATTTMTEGAG